jgi:rRNA-processing protein Efg1
VWHIPLPAFIILKDMVKAPSLGAVRSGSVAPSDSAALSTSHSASYYGKKFKPWRRGKSIHSKRHNDGGKKPSGGSSLKQQLRGLKRLQEKKLSELPQSNGGEAPNNGTMNEQLTEVQQKIDTIQEQLSLSHTSIKERENARRSHKTRFVDRQRTTRFYKQWVKQLQKLEANHTKESNVEMQRILHELYKLALDQVYIAHYPLDVTSYVSIYQNGSQARRQVMNNRLLYKMATQRQCVLERLHASKIPRDNATTNIPANPSAKVSNVRPRQMQRAPWIHPSQYERVQHLTTWSTQSERSTFDIIIPSHEQKQSIPVNDDRFKIPTDIAKHLVLEHERLEQELEMSHQDVTSVHLTNQRADTYEDDSVHSDEDEADPLISSKPSHVSKYDSPSSDNDSSRSDTDSSGSSDDGSDRNNNGVNDDLPQSRSENDSDPEVLSDRLPENVAVESETMTTAASLRALAAKKSKAMSVPVTNASDDDDDFLLETSAFDDAVQSNVFAHAKHHVPANDGSKGDKSKGWATQKQLPGQFRKKRRR